MYMANDKWTKQIQSKIKVLFPEKYWILFHQTIYPSLCECRSGHGISENFKLTNFMLKTEWDCMNPTFSQNHILLAVMFIRKWSTAENSKTYVILWGILHLFAGVWADAVQSLFIKYTQQKHKTKSQWLSSNVFTKIKLKPANPFDPILVKTMAYRPSCLLCCWCLCIAPSTGCLWLFVMDCKPWCSHTVQPREPQPIPPGDAPALHATRTLRSASLFSFSD